MHKEPLYDQRYPPPDIWKNISALVRSLCCICCYPGCYKPAKQTHHACYLDLDNQPLNYITINDIKWLAGRILFPVCLEHHKILHQPQYWNSGQHWSRLDARQHPKVLGVLIEEYKQKAIHKR